ncbi:hypothetical protein DC914_RS28695 [Vibrio parahaemolyticus]|uniref:hypothetical protein n=1 Tax=Vibrio parahaemolyticus TaxID=670 RepID=UPI0006A5C625|nr:hypothetical protein [Vibrio parahaemolyticus]EGR5928014.1 hypothetical protein [Vibrio parahaemolyticus]EJG0181996.1 hypothetical protein [Vibrio parahaemolyticus]KOE80235.1 hypothetical protein ACS91_23065 [Vibrio parahaemolyticus]KOY37976.1 hypothetical protein ACX10_12070 [Vibrio parahaemolyticus]MCS0114782.1 hypothetical protein [Vibrio parahaemolyticus]
MYALLLPVSIIAALAFLFTKHIVDKKKDFIESRKRNFYNFKSEKSEKTAFTPDFEFDKESLVSVSSQTNEFIFMRGEKADICKFDRISHISIEIKIVSKPIADITVFFINGDSIKVPFVNDIKDAFRFCTLFENNMGKDPFSKDGAKIKSLSIID